jgi:Protein of unknown function (DUF1524)
MERSVLAVETASDGRLWCSQPCTGGVRCGHRSSLGPSTAPASQPPGFRLSLEVPRWPPKLLQLPSSPSSRRSLMRSDSRSPVTWPVGVRDFAFELLLCRNLFDSYILKRQFTATNGDDGDWSLQRLLKRASRGRSTHGYINTFSGGSAEAEEDDDVDPTTNDLLLLQSMLRVTYTSPRTMHWITKLLTFLTVSAPGTVPRPRLAKIARDYARAKVIEAFFVGEEPTGFSISRVAFTYLDYLLPTGQQKSEFRFAFRNSIEHFYPQHPDEQQSGAVVSARHLDLLGNLALVSVGANSKFSNSLPRSKAENFRTTIETQSPKLQEMARITRDREWGDAEVRSHHQAMIALLRSDPACSQNRSIATGRFYS